MKKIISISDKHLIILLLVGALGGYQYSYGGELKVPQSLRSLPVQSHGRVMPLESFAVELLIEVTGRQRMKGEVPVVTVMNWMSDPGRTWEIPLFNVGYEPLLRELGLPLTQRKFSLNDLLSRRRLMQLASESARIKEQNGKPSKVQGEAEKLLGKMGSLYALTTRQTPRFIPPSGEPDGLWGAISEGDLKGDSVAMGIALGIEGLLNAWKRGNESQVNLLAGEVKRLIDARWNPDPVVRKRFEGEVLYNRWRPVFWARSLYLGALLVLIGSLIGYPVIMVKIAQWLVSLGFLIHSGSLGLRAYIGERAPWSNFYESLLTVSALLVILGLIFAYRSKLKGVILAVVSLGGYLSLLINDRSGLSPGVDTLVPALQSYWLTIHVVVLLIGYACATLAMLLGHATLFSEALHPRDRARMLTLSNATYRSVQLAMLFVFAGTILGGVWAHEAWGRYWGWDPKETWALITWFGYLGVAHARFAGWLSPRGIALAAIGVFPLVLMTYYGVNYLLSGLHSYAGGESASVPPLIIAFLVLETFVVVVGITQWHLKWTPEGRAYLAEKDKNRLTVATESTLKTSSS